MSVFFIGDPHFGHKKIEEYRPMFGGNDHMIKTHWRLIVRKKDIVYVLGDAAMNNEALLEMGKLPGRKVLISGNHDILTSQEVQRQVFEKVYGFMRYKGMWLSHAPVHPQSLEGFVKWNVHGHTHGNGPFDKRYLSVDVGVLLASTQKCLINLERLREIRDRL